MASKHDARINRLMAIANTHGGPPMFGTRTLCGQAEYDAWLKSPDGRKYARVMAGDYPREAGRFVGLILKLCDRETMERQQRQAEAARARQPKPPPFHQERRRQAGPGVDAEHAPHTINDPARAARQEIAGDERRSALDFNFWDV